jgi:hypothetical protein
MNGRVFRILLVEVAPIGPKLGRSMFDNILVLIPWQ